MKKLQILIIIFLISISISAFAITQVKADVTDVNVSPVGPILMDVGQVQKFTVSAIGYGSLSYQWYLNNSPVGTSISEYSFTASSSGSYSITVSVVDILGIPETSTPVSVVVSALPTVAVLPVGPVTLSSGQVQVFSAAAIGGSGVIHYQWSLGGSIVSGATSSTYSFSGLVGLYSVTCKVTDSASVPVTSVASNAVIVTVNAVPTVGVSPLSWVMDVGQSKLFSATASGGSGSYTSYQWYLGGVVQSGATASTFSYSPASAGGPYLLTVTVTDSSGMTSVQSSAASVTVAASPTVSIGPVGPVKMDVGQVQLFSATGGGGSGSLSYQWYLDGSAVGGNSASYTYTAAGVSHSVTCKVSDSASVPFTSGASNAVSVVVSPALVAPTVTSTPGTVNQGQTSGLSSSVVSTGTSPYTYQWLQRAPGAGSYSSISSATSSSYSFVTSGSTATGAWSFELQITDAASAIKTSSAVAVTVNAVPTVVVSPVSWIMDVGQIKTFSASASGGSGSYTSYQWYLGGVVQSGATASTFSYVPGSIGSYLLTVTVTDSLATNSAESSAGSIMVNAVPAVSVAPVGPIMINVGQVQVFSAIVSGGSGYLSYQWYLGGSPVSGATGSTYSFSGVVGSYSVTCKVVDSASVPVTSGISNVGSVTVNAALVAPVVSASLGTINQGQASDLSSSVVSTGSSPYLYQWLSRAPGAGSYSLISGATSSSYSFVTSIATATGGWSFLLQVRDNAAVTVNSSAVSVTVNIPPLDHFVFSSVGTQTAGSSFSITITAKDASNNTLTNFVGTNTLNVSNGTISPTSTGAFSKGVWTGSVIVTGADSGVTLFTTGSGMTGTSNSFKVNSGALNHFTFSTVSSSQTAVSGFSITVTANDVYDNTVTSYVGNPSLTVSSGSISPSTMNAFVNGAGSTTVTVTGESSGVTITVADSTYSGVSNSFAVTISPTPAPTPTTNPTAPPSSTSQPTPTPMRTSTPTPTAKPSPSPTPLETTVKAKTDNGATVNLAINGNVTSAQMSSVTLTTSQSANSTTLAMTVTGQSGTTGFSNITIPKTAILYGTKPVVFIDDQQATNQGYTQDSENFYVWYTMHFSTHQMKIQFAGSLNAQTSSFVPLLVVGIITPEIILVYTVIAVRRLRRRPENT